jgi:hypothetical protein
MHAFDPLKFVQQTAEQLIHAFTVAEAATTPGLTGSARENALRKNLEALLPPTAGVSTGVVIDSYGDVSKQTDVVIFDRQFYRGFEISPEAIFYPCEGVIAAGEVKSNFGREELKDSFAKCASVKKLRRYAEKPEEFRSYGSPDWIGITDEARTEWLDPKTRATDQIFYFVLCRRIEMSPKTLVQNIAELSDGQPRHLLPNMIISLNDGIFAYSSPRGNWDTGIFSPIDSSYVLHFNDPAGSFHVLLNQIHTMIVTGRTTRIVPLVRYIGDKTRGINPTAIELLK